MKTTKKNLFESFKNNLKQLTKKGKEMKDNNIKEGVKDNHILKRLLEKEKADYLYF